jgi:hypothetical protein
MLDKNCVCSYHFIDEFRAVKTDECRIVQFDHPWCEGLSPTRLRRRHETFLLASWGDVRSLVLCPGYIRDTLLVAAFRRISVEVLQLQVSQISVFSDSASFFPLTLYLLSFGTALLPLFHNIRTIYWLAWRQLLKCMILCTTWQRFRPPALETTLWVCGEGGWGLSASIHGCMPLYRNKSRKLFLSVTNIN